MIHGFEPEVPQVQCHIDLDKDKSGIVLVRRLLEHTVCQDGEKERQLWQQRVEASLALVSCPILAKLGQNAAAARCTCIQYPCSWMQRCRCWKRRRRVRCMLSAKKVRLAGARWRSTKYQTQTKPRSFCLGSDSVLLHPPSEYTMQQRCILGLMPPPHAFQMRPVSVLFTTDSRRFFYP